MAVCNIMRQILVIGSVNHDRIWQLESPIASGRRVRVRGKSLVLGGGGFHTGKALLELGETVALVSRLRRDELGLAALSTLNDIGFQTQHVELVDGETKPLDILLDPNGERTILIPVRDGDGPIQIAEAAPVRSGLHQCSSSGRSPARCARTNASGHFATAVDPGYGAARGLCHQLARRHRRRHSRRLETGSRPGRNPAEIPHRHEWTRPDRHP